MATDKKISDLSVASSIDSSDSSIVLKNGIDYQFGFNTLLEFVGAELTVGAAISFGTSLPPNISGKNGDVFINTTAGNIAQKMAGVWAIVYTFPTNSTSDGSVLYGTSVPGATVGKNDDTFINTLSGIFYKKVAGTWSQVFSMQTGPPGSTGPAGPTGAAGTNGKTILSGTGTPSNLYTGTNGDYYINTSTYVFYGPKTNGVWPEGFSLDNSESDALATEVTAREAADAGLQGQIDTLTSKPEFDMIAYIKNSPIYASDVAAISLSPYSMYRTTTGELRYKLPDVITPEPPTNGITDDEANTFTYTGGEA